MSDASSNMSKPNLDTSTGEIAKSQLEEEQTNEAAMPAAEEKVALPPQRRGPAGPEAQFQVPQFA